MWEYRSTILTMGRLAKYKTVHTGPMHNTIPAFNGFWSDQGALPDIDDCGSPLPTQDDIGRLCDHVFGVPVPCWFDAIALNMQINSRRRLKSIGNRQDTQNQKLHKKFLRIIGSAWKLVDSGSDCRVPAKGPSGDVNFDGEERWGLKLWGWWKC